MSKTIESIHVCGGEVYVARSGKWYRVIEKGMTHCFAELRNWPEEHWERNRRDPPCCEPLDGWPSPTRECA